MKIEKLGKVSRAGAPNIYLTSATRNLISICLTAPDKSGNLTEQTVEILGVIDSFLAECGSERANVMMAQVWIGDMEEFPIFRDAWNGWLNEGPTPALSVVQAAASRRDSLIEIRVYAAP